MHHRQLATPRSRTQAATASPKPQRNQKFMRNEQRRLVARPWWALLGLLAGCIESAPNDRFACRVDRDCQDGWYCVAQVCAATRLTDVGGISEAGGGQGGAGATGGIDAGGAGGGGAGGGAGGVGGGGAAGVGGGAGGVGGGAGGAGGAGAIGGAGGGGGVGGVGGAGGAGGGGAGGGAGGAGGVVPSDVDADGISDGLDNCPSEANPGQQDLDRDGVGDHCESCDGDAQCRVQLNGRCDDEDGCEGLNVQRIQFGSCIAGVCGAHRPELNQLSSCARGTRCHTVDNRAFCDPDPTCPGGACRLEGESQRCPPVNEARCVLSACQPWSCERPECNETGPDFLGVVPAFTEESLRNQEGFLLDQRTNSLWYLPAEPVADLAAAHTFCANPGLQFDDHSWRLPTWYELAAFAQRTKLDAELLTAAGWPPDEGEVYLSRTVVGDTDVMGVYLGSGRVVRKPRQQPPGARYMATCIAHDVRVTNLAARGVAFAAAGPEVTDPLTGLTWHREIIPALSLDQAQQTCLRLGKELPTIDAALSLLTFQAGATPGLWLAWDGRTLGRGAGLIWTANTGHIVVDRLNAWVVDLGTGEVREQAPGDQAAALCMHR